MGTGTLARIAGKATLTIAAAAATWGVMLAPMGGDAPISHNQVSAVSACVAYEGAQRDYDGTSFMYEDEAPYRGLFGGELTDYRDGQAWFDDGSMSDGTCWSSQESAPELF